MQLCEMIHVQNSCQTGINECLYGIWEAHLCYLHDDRARQSAQASDALIFQTLESTATTAKSPSLLLQTSLTSLSQVFFRTSTDPCILKAKKGWLFDSRSEKTASAFSLKIIPNRIDSQPELLYLLMCTGKKYDEIPREVIWLRYWNDIVTYPRWSKHASTVYLLSLQSTPVGQSETEYPQWSWESDANEARKIMS